MNVIAFSWRAFRRELRSGELAILLAAMTVAVGALAAVGFFTDRMRVAMNREAGESLAADLAIESRNPIPESYAQQARAAGLDIARVLFFPSVATTASRSQLVEIRAVGGAYPLRGRVRVSEVPFGPQRAAEGLPAAGEIWIEPRLLATLDLEIGDVLRLGARDFRITRTLAYVPDQGWNFVDIAPTVLMNLADIPATGLVGPASRVHHRLLVAGDRNAVMALRAALEPGLARGERLLDVRDGRPEMRRALERAERFLGLAALVAVLLAGVAIAMAARRYAQREMDAAALLKCLGAPQRVVVGAYALQIVWAGLLGGLAGLGVGFLAQEGLVLLVADLLQQALPPPGFATAPLALVMGCVILAGFALPPVMQLGRTPPLRVLRHDAVAMPLPAYAAYALALASVVVLLVWMVRDATLALTLLGGVAGGALLLAAGAWCLVWALGRLRGRVGVAWRYGAANVTRRGRASVVQVVAFGVGLLVLLLLALVRNDLMQDWRASLPPDAPNHFLINIQSDETGAVEAFFREHGLPAPKLHPLVRARLVSINAIPVTEFEAREPRARWFLEREQNLSWSAELDPSNVLVAGAWWPPNAHGQSLVSIEEKIAHEVGFRLGDELVFDIAGEQVGARIASFRQVRWDSFRPNFFIVLAPGVLEGYPATYIASLHLPPERAGVLLELVRRLPSITVIDLDAVLGQIRRVMDQAARAVEYVFLFTLAAGVLVLLAAVQSSLDERRFESALLRALGASRRTVLTGVAAEFLLLGLLAGLLAALAASGVAWLLARQVFELAWTFDAALWAVAALAGTALVGTTGVLATRSVIDHPPLATLRKG
ncbi:MAG TPA: FtsX-like permease family protein [Gammaproteobacteria bacterium]|nr:FtsX-like permease family protein [Gammaproteobacteria bacterium]